FTFHEDDQCSFQRIRQAPRWKERRFDQSTQDVERAIYFLPYIRRFLFGSTEDPEWASVPSNIKRFDFDLSTLGTLEHDALPMSVEGFDDRDKQQHKHELLLDHVQLLLSPFHVGLLLFRVHHRDPQTTYLQQMHAVQFLRMLTPLYEGFEMPKVTLGTQSQDIGDWVRLFLREFRYANDATPLETILDLPVRPSYDDRMLVYTFSLLRSESCITDLERAERALELFSFSNFSSFDQNPKPYRKNSKNKDPVSSLENQDVQDWLRNRWQTLSKEGSCLIAFDRTHFHRKFLGGYHESHYFDIFLLATLQRVALLLLFERLADIRGLTTFNWEGQKTLRKLRRDLLMFKNKCWSSQITQREKGLHLWQQYQKAYDVEPLMKEVNEQSTELSKYLQDRTRQQVEWGVRLGGFLVTAIPAIFGLEVLLGKAPWVNTLRWVLTFTVIFATAVVAWRVLFHETLDE
ncbi:MAG: hypothetical protein AAGJ35_00525, partial [Myxococcota bacterium]